MRGAGKKQYCGKAGGAPFACGERDSDGLSFQDGGFERSDKAGGYSCSGGREAEVYYGRVRERGRGGHRCGNPPEGKRKTLRGCGF